MLVSLRSCSRGDISFNCSCGSRRTIHSPLTDSVPRFDSNHRPTCSTHHPLPLVNQNVRTTSELSPPSAYYSSPCNTCTDHLFALSRAVSLFCTLAIAESRGSDDGTAFSAADHFKAERGRSHKSADARTLRAQASSSLSRPRRRRTKKSTRTTQP